jgi:outer membrane lipoprotein-sorting protein
MRKPEKVTVVALSLGCLMAASALAQVTPGAAKVLAGVGEAYSVMSTFQAEGTMQIEMHSPGMETKMETPIALTLRSPDEMRMEMTSGGMKLDLTMDNSTLWMYMPLLNAYMKIDLPGNPSKNAEVKNYCLFQKYRHIANQAEESRIRRSDSITVNGQPAECWVVEIRYKPPQATPGRSASAVKTSVKVESSNGELWVEKTHHWILRERTYVKTEMRGTTAETRQSMTFTKVTVDRTVAASLFTFVPPSGAKELDLSKLMSGLQGATK